MELLERYLHAVKKHLPRNRAADIVEELRANILAQAEDRQEQLGRALHLEEEEAILKQHGHPMLVAARYLPQRHLIGPTVFPYYWYALKMALPIVAGVYFLINALRFISEPLTSGRVIDIVLHFFSVAATAGVWITVAFVVMEYTTSKYIRDPQTLWSWKPRDLPPVEPVIDEPEGRPGFADLMFQAFALPYLLAIPHFPFLLLGPAAAYLQYFHLAPAWYVLYWGMIALLCAQILIQCASFVWPQYKWTRPYISLLADAAVCVLMIAIAFFLTRDHQYVALADSVRDNPQYQSFVRNLNYGIFLSLRITVVITAVQFLWELGKLLIKRPRPEGVAVGGQ